MKMPQGALPVLRRLHKARCELRTQGWAVGREGVVPVVVRAANDGGDGDEVARTLSSCVAA